MTSSQESINLPLSRPMGLCDLIGMAFRIWRTNLPLIFQVLIVPTIIYYLSATVLQWCFTYGVKNFSELGKLLATFALGTSALAAYVFAVVILSVRQLALVRLFTGFAVDWKRAIAFSRKKTWWLLGLFAIMFLMGVVMGGIVFCAIFLTAVMSKMGPAAAAVSAAIIIAAFLAFFLLLGAITILGFMGFSVLACEDTGFFGVIGQTFHWTFKYFGRVLCFGLIFYVVFSVVGIPVSIPIAIATICDATLDQIKTGAAEPKNLSLAAMIFVQAWEGLASLLLRPVTVIAFGLFYLDLRLRSDGLDLSRKLGELSNQLPEVDNGA